MESGQEEYPLKGYEEGCCVGSRLRRVCAGGVRDAWERVEI